MSKAKVLIVDDEKEFREGMSERLEMRGYEVESAGTGVEALDMLDKASYDAIMLDLQMPHMDGMETLKRIRESHPEMQVILLTGHATLEKGVEAVKLGALDFLEKPAEIGELTDKIKQAKNKRLLLVEKQREEAIQDVLLRHSW